MSKGEKVAIFVTLALAALISGPWFYTQLLVWKAEGHDHMLTVANIILTVILWLALAYGIYRNFRDARRAEAAKTKLVNEKYEHDLQMKAAQNQITVWSNAFGKKSEECNAQIILAKQSLRDYNTEVEAHKQTKLKERDANTLKDQAEQREEAERVKRIKEEARVQENYDLYQQQVRETNAARIAAKDAENERDTARQHVASLSEQLEEQTKEVNREAAKAIAFSNGFDHEVKLHNETKEELRKLQEDVAVLRSAREAPQLLVEYALPNLEKEHLTFVNEGPGTLQGIAIGPLLWGTAFSRELHLHNVLGPLSAGKSVECKFAVVERIGGSQSISSLVDAIREVARKGCEAGPQATGSYLDIYRNRCSRRFVFSIDPSNMIVCKLN